MAVRTEAVTTEAGRRDLDMVLFGATGVAGGLTAEYLVRSAPPGLRWALAGRDPVRLAEVGRRLRDLDRSLDRLEVLAADAHDPAALAVVARRARVVASTVGPFVRHGAPLVAACAEAGTDYVDLSGEAEFVDRMWLAHHATARRSGARLVHACGFEAVPCDLGVLQTVRLLPGDLPITVRGVVRAGAVPSAGTLQTAVTALARVRQARAAAAARRRREAPPEGRSSRAVTGKPGRDPVLGYWLLPLPTIDPLVVARSGVALPAYGPRFRYSHHAGTRTLRYAVGGAAVVATVGAAAQVPALRDLMLRRVDAGDGPDAARRARSWFRVDIVGEAGGRTVHTRVSGGDPGYTESAVMLAEAALCLALDDNPPCSGQVTTAQAMGDHLTARLQRAGIRFESTDLTRA